ncbi:putative RNA recognition motif domain, nucleotide-binding alpha-beta plait domain superfamily [Helianthus annuus]|nr:putative RNA recognition motif domain, nucleotide-binding alpha-beta plait domain superfamily [Helianthus annuus]
MVGRERYKVDTWYDAPTRKGRRSDQGERPKQNDLPVTKYFVSNLPEGCSSADLMAVLKGFGSIKSIYIARKCDKLGKRFGFVSFVNVRDPEDLEILMKDVWIGSYKLYVVLARFVDGERPKQNDLPVTKYFVSNLPEGCSSADLMAVLKGFGSIKSIYIARKCDKLGKRFGFVSFVNVRDPEDLEIRRKDVWIGSYKLYVVLARFVDGERVLRKGEKQWVPVRNEDEGLDSGKGNRKETHVEETSNAGQGKGDGRSFRDTLLNVDPPKKDSEIVVTAAAKGGMLWEGCGAVGRVSDLKKLSKLRIWLDLVGQAKVGIRYLGGFWVMLLFDSDVRMEGFVRTKEVWRVCFDSLERWDGQVIHTDRIAWLKIYGVPLMLYDESLFNDIGSKFGTVVQLPECDEATVDLSCVMIGVLRKTGLRVNEMISVRWKEEVFPVVVEEEMGEWVPECLDDCSVYSESGLNIADGADVDGQGCNMEAAVDSGCAMEQVETDIIPEEEISETVVGEQNDQQVGGFNNDTVLDTVGINTEAPNNRGKKTRGFRKKARAQKSPSPPGQETPEKRAREREDLFDIDRFIYAINGNEEKSREDITSSVGDWG